jgi:hypothetical protein
VHSAKREITKLTMASQLRSVVLKSAALVCHPWSEVMKFSYRPNHYSSPVSFFCSSSSSNLSILTS